MQVYSLVCTNPCALFCSVVYARIDSLLQRYKRRWESTYTLRNLIDKIDYLFAPLIRKHTDYGIIQQ